MKIIAIILITFYTNSLFANCEFSKDIKQVPEGYLYSPDCHKEAGKAFQDQKDREQQVRKYEDLLKLKDDVVLEERQRAEMWRDTTFKLEDRMSKIEEYKNSNNWIYFGLGVVVTIGAGWAIGQAAGGNK